jgi:acetyl-CoA C-acetyltransferase
MSPDDIVIVAAKRTPCGQLLGNLSSLSAPELAAVAHRAVIAAAGISANEITEVFTGCVLQAGIGQAPARQAALLAGIPDFVGATTINKMCGSGMKAVMIGHDAIKAGSARVILAGGMESMSSAPYLLTGARKGYRLGHGELIDHLRFDGLEDAYEPGRLMGCFADQTAEKLHLTREAQDIYAARSMMRALAAQQVGAFDDEIAPVTVHDKGTERLIHLDEGPDPTKPSKLARLRPSFTSNGTVTAGNSSSISDGAASILFMSAREATRLNLRPLAKIVAHVTHAGPPAEFTTAPMGAISALLAKINWQAHDVDLYEINEAFAVVAMATIEHLHLDIEKVNIHGGACALGHPIGASGARIIVTLLHALERHQKSRGIAALCIGGGEATAMAIERL